MELLSDNNKNNDFSLSIIVLAYNEEDSIYEAVKDIADFLKDIKGNHEIIIIDDGSTDKTYEKASEAQELYPDVRIISHEKNLGMGAGTRTGIKNTTRKYFSIIGADSQISPFELKKLIPQLKDYEIVISTYVKRPGFLRKLLSRGMRIFLKLMLNFTIPYEGLYIFPKEVIMGKIGLSKINSNSFFFSFEMLFQAKKLGISMTSVLIECKERERGQSKVLNLNKILNVISEIVKLAWREKYEKR